MSGRGISRKTNDYEAGEFRTLVDVYAPSDTADDAGGKTRVWVKQFTIWCAVEDWSGRERYGDAATGRVITENLTIFATWWRADIDTTMALVTPDGTKYNIRRVSNAQDRNKFLEMRAESGAEL